MSRPPARPRVALTIVAAASRLVPGSVRDRWRREWEGELIARSEELEARGALTVGARLDLIARALGSGVDAVFYGKGWWGVGGLREDVRLAGRTLWRRPGFSALIVLTLTIGIGGSTALFGVASDVLLRPFPYPDPERVVAVRGFQADGSGFSGNVSYPNLADLDAAARTFEAIGGARWWSPALEDDRGAVVLRGGIVTPNFFEILGVEPYLGRFLDPTDESVTETSAVVLSHALWVDRFGADPGLVGRDVRLDGRAHRVIGITGPDFEDPWLLGGPGAEPQLWRSVTTPPSESFRSGRSWRGIGRVRPDVTLEAAQDELDALYAGLADAYPEANADRVVRIDPIRELVAGPARPVLLTLLGAVGFLLLIACVNLANLLLGRALDRRGSFAVHRALGAPGWRIFNQSLAEAVLLAALGGATGLALAVWLSRLAKELGPVLPRPLTGRVDLGVLGFALAVTVSAAMLVGLLPALHAARTRSAVPGRDGGRGATGSRAGHRLRRGLVVAEVALTTTLLVGSGLLLRSFQRLGAVDLGLNVEQVVSVTLHGSAWWSLEPEAALAQWTEVLDAARAVPGVQAAGAIDYVPLSGNYSCDLIMREDRPPPGPGEGRCAEVRAVLPGALEALGVQLARGRLIDDRDGPETSRTAVIDENMAEAFWPGEEALGARIQVHGNVHEVVGIVENQRHFGPAGAERPMVYLPAPQEGWNGISRGLSLLARGPEAGALIPRLRAAVADVDRSIAIGETDTLQGLLGRSLAAERFRTGLMVAFGVIALMLAALGLAGVMTFSVARRTRELGVRLALGAPPRRVRLLVLREGALLGLGGVALGVAGALVLSRILDSVLLEALLFQTLTYDPAVYAGATALLAAASLLACYLPARRASNVDPTRALSVE